jgi:glycosyltransferase involved in cell wall biosynthesis
MPIRLATIVSHPIQYFAPWHREMARVPGIDSKVFFCCDWGVTDYVDPGFNMELAWDIPLLDGYAHEFLPVAGRLRKLNFWETDNPTVSAALDQFRPDIVTVFGYAYRTNWRAALWSRRNRRPLLLYSDSNVRLEPALWKRGIKDIIVRRFYRYVDGALFIGENNRLYHARYGVSPDRLFPGVYPIERRRLLRAVPDRSATRAALRRTLGIPRDAFVVLFCGKYIGRKRPMDVIVAVHSLAKKGVPVWALLVGEGEERHNLEAFCERERVTNAVLSGFVNQSAIPSYYAASDVIAVTSSFEAYGLVASEASVFGLPILASDRVGCIGPNDTAQPGRNAIVYPCGNIQRLAECIEQLWRDGELYKRMAMEASHISESQDVVAATQQLAFAARKLHELGPRRSNLKNRDLFGSSGFVSS